MIARMMIDKRPVLRLLALALLAVVLIGTVCADCGEGGWSQGGSDSSPSWRKS